MNERGIFFLSRLRDRVALFDTATGKRFDLLGALRRQGRLDIDLLAGLEEKLPVRIVAVPVSDRIANERRRKANGNRDKRYRPAAESQELPGWEIFMTNVPRSVWSTKTASSVYFLRWRIEIIFKAWKSYLNLKEMPNGSKEVVMVCILAKLLYITWFHTAFAQMNVKIGQDFGRRLSLLKASALFNLLLVMQIGSLMIQTGTALLSDILTKLCCYEKRRKRKGFHETLESLG